MKIFKLILIALAVISLVIGGMYLSEYLSEGDETSGIDRTKFNKIISDSIAVMKNESWNKDKYDLLDFKIDHLLKDKHVSQSDAIEQHKALDLVYIDLLSEAIKEEFDNRRCNGARLNNMYGEVKKFDKKYTNHKDLQEASVIINNYFNAKSVIAQANMPSKVNSINDRFNFNQAEKLVSDAKMYKTKPYINNCSDIVNGLNNVPGALEKAHFNFVNNKVDYFLSLDYKDTDAFYADRDIVYTDLQENYLDKVAIYGISSSTANSKISPLTRKVKDFEKQIINKTTES